MKIINTNLENKKLSNSPWLANVDFLSIDYLQIKTKYILFSIIVEVVEESFVIGAVTTRYPWCPHQNQSESAWVATLSLSPEMITEPLLWKFEFFRHKIMAYFILYRKNVKSSMNPTNYLFSSLFDFKILFLNVKNKSRKAQNPKIEAWFL